MPYSARVDVEARLPALPDPNENQEDLSEETIKAHAKISARVEQGIEYADAEIDATLAAVYLTPFCPVPTLIRHISADLAAAFSLDGGFSGGGENEETKLAKAIRSRAQDKLKLLLEKKLTLPDASPAEEPPAVSARVVATHSHLGQRPTLQCFDLYNEPT